MTLTELRYIVAVARDKHFGRAAHRCFVSQPTLSIAIKKLEDELGVILFERGGTEVMITELGERIIEQAQRILDEVDIIKQLAGTIQNELAGPLKLGIIPTISPYLLPNLIPALRELAPEMPLLIEETPAPRLIEMLKRGEIEVMITTEGFNEPGTTPYPLYSEPFVVALPKGHSWENLTAIELTQLVHTEDTLLNWDETLHTQFLHSNEALPHSPRYKQHTVSLEQRSLTTIGHMVASGLGIAILPVTVVRHTDPTGSLLSIVPFSAPIPKRQVNIVIRKQYTRQKTLAVLQQAILLSDLGKVDTLTQPPYA